MSTGARRRRGLLLLSLSLACGGLAASMVGERVAAVERQVGRPLPVVVAKRELPAGRRIAARDLAVEHVPQRYLPPDALADPLEAAGARPAAPVGAGGYVTLGHLARAAGRPAGASGLRRGERALELTVAGGAALTAAAGPGSRVDVLVSTEAGASGGRSFLALEAVELLGLRPGGGPALEGGEGGPAAAATATATLRVTARQAVYLTAAQNFARELRLLARPSGDERRIGAVETAAGEL